MERNAELYGCKTASIKIKYEDSEEDITNKIFSIPWGFERKKNQTHIKHKQSQETQEKKTVKKSFKNFPHCDEKNNKKSKKTNKSERK